MSIELIVHNIGFIISAISAIVAGVVVYLKGSQKVSNILFSLGSIAVAVFCISHVIGVNVVDSELSRKILMFNLANLFITPFMAHSVLAVLGETRKFRWVLALIYSVAAVLFVIYTVFPETFLLTSVPKLYFPNYYEPGQLEWVMRFVFNIIVPAFFMYRIGVAWTKADHFVQNRLLYFLLPHFFGYVLGGLAVPLIYDYAVDPVFAAFFVPIYTIPMAFAMIKYNLYDIRVVALRALIFGFVVAVTSLVILLVGYANFILLSINSSFPQWVLPLFAGIVAAAIGFFVWNKFRESEVLKYEFVTIVTHKLRTPLTSIKWSADGLETYTPPEGKIFIEHIKKSTEQLVQLTTVLANVSSEEESYLYKVSSFDIVPMTKHIAEEAVKTAQDHTISMHIPSEIALVEGDESKIQFVIQNLMNNAVTYTPKGGHIEISVLKEKKNVVISITDSGVGFAKSEEKLLFNRFYRTDEAKKADTNGMGIALYICRRVIERHGGTLWAQSPGSHKGSTFYVSLPLKR